MQRSHVARDAVAAVLLLAAALLPWNLYFGIGIPDSNGVLFALLAAVTVLSLAGIALSHTSAAGRVSRLPAALNAPYGLLVLGFVGFDLVQTVRYGGSGNVPGGVGPGAWLGISGALLGAHPAAADEGDRPLPARVIGVASIALASLSVVFNLFWRIKAVLPGSSGSSDKLSASIMVTALVYGVVALIVVIVAARWLTQRNSQSSHLATVALGVSTLAAGVVVWILPIGREIDGFHGIAQNTSTAGVGFEGYLAWAAAAAIFAPPTLLRVLSDRRIDRGIWRAAARKGLSFIAVWCIASVLMRATDVAVAAVLHLSRSPYDSAATAAFDVVTAALAIWLRVNLVNRPLPFAVITSLCGVLFVLTVSRIVLGVALSTRIAGAPAQAGNPVYGNNLAQQITSTLDVVLAGLALCILATALVAARAAQRRPQDEHPTPPASHDAATTRLAAGDAPTTVMQSAQPRRVQHPTRPPTGPTTMGPSNADATQQLSPPAPRIFRPGPGSRREVPPAASRQPPPRAPRIHRAQRDPRAASGDEPPGGSRGR